MKKKDCNLLFFYSPATNRRYEMKLINFGRFVDNSAFLFTRSTNISYASILLAMPGTWIKIGNLASDGRIYNMAVAENNGIRHSALNMIFPNVVALEFVDSETDEKKWSVTLHYFLHYSIEMNE